MSRANIFVAARVLSLIIVSLLGAAAAPAFDRLDAASVVPSIAMPEPGYLRPASDPALGTPFMRVTNPDQPGSPKLPCRRSYCTHRYSSAQAWNADQTLLLIENGCRGFCFLDGQTYVPLFVRPSSDDECEWHPTDPALMVCVSADRIYTWNPRNGIRSTIFAPADYRHLQFGPYKGNLSKDGKRLVARATDRSGALVAFAYDLSTRSKYPDIVLSGLQGDNGYCTISPSGRYVFCAQDMPDATSPAYVFTVDGSQVQTVGGPTIFASPLGHRERLAGGIQRRWTHCRQSNSLTRQPKHRSLARG